MNKNFKQLISVYIVFLLLAIVSVIPFWHTGMIFGKGDLLFHLNRITGLADGINQHVLPYRFYNVLTNIGSTTNFFYPFFFFMGWAQLFNIFGNPVHAFYFGELLIQFATLVIAYHSIRLIKKDSHYQALVFAILYGFSMYRFYIGYDQFVLGELLAYTFLPLAFAGFYNVIFNDYKKWLALPIGLSLILYSHMLSAFLTLSIFFIIFIGAVIYKNKNFKKERIKVLFKSVILTLVLTAVIYLPFLYQFRLKSIKATDTSGISKESSLSQSIISAFDMTYANIGLLGLIAVVLVFIALFRKKYSMNTLVGGIGVMLFITSTTLFPWSLVPKALQMVVQFPYRLLGLTTLFLMYFLSTTLITIFKNKREMVILIPAITVMMFGLFITKAENTINERLNQPGLKMNNLFYNDDAHFETTFKADAQQLKNLKDSRHDYIGIMDYAPIESWSVNNYYSIMTHDVFIDKQIKHPNFSYYVDHAVGTIYLDKNAKVDLPFLSYGNETIKVNNKLVKSYSTSRGTVGIDLPSGKATIYVGYKTPKWIYGLWIFTIISWLIIVITNIVIKIKNTRYVLYQ